MVWLVLYDLTRKTFLNRKHYYRYYWSMHTVCLQLHITVPCCTCIYNSTLLYIHMYSTRAMSSDMHIK